VSRLFFGSGSHEYVGQTIVAFVTGIFKHRLLHARHRERATPRSRPGVRIIHCELVVEGVGINAREAFDHVQRFAEVAVEVSDEGLVVEMRGLNNEGVTVPMAT